MTVNTSFNWFTSVIHHNIFQCASAYTFVAIDDLETHNSLDQRKFIWDEHEAQVCQVRTNLRMFVCTDGAERPSLSKIRYLSGAVGSCLATMRQNLDLPKNGFYQRTAVPRGEGVGQCSKHLSPGPALTYCRPWRSKEPHIPSFCWKELEVGIGKELWYNSCGLHRKAEMCFPLSHLGTGAREAICLKSVI